MLYLERQQLETIEDLHAALANAIKLEFSTIPPYLTALFSIRPGHNAAAATIIRSVVIEEMLHLSLACNLLNAVGGCPDLVDAVPTYPTELPMGIGDQPGRTFVVPLKRLSHETLGIFMTIEEPEHPLVLRTRAPAVAPETTYRTIGEFYTAVAALIGDLGEGIFTGHRDRQVTGWIGADLLAPVHDLPSAQAAITLIIDQGEGTATSPAADPEELAHFYRFEQIQRGQTLTQDTAAPHGYSWGPPAVILDPDGVWPMTDNPPLVPLPAGSEVARVSDQFDGTFTALVDALQSTFDGNPGALGSAMAQMHALRIEAQRLVPLAVPDTNGTAGPRYVYTVGRTGGVHD